MTYPIPDHLKELTEYLSDHIMDEIGETTIDSSAYEEIQAMLVETIKNGIEAFCSGAGNDELDDPCQQARSNYIQITWHREDIQGRRPDLTEDQCRAVLSKLKRQHDATIGINWDVIDIVAESEFPEPDNLDELREQYDQRYG